MEQIRLEDIAWALGSISVFVLLVTAVRYRTAVAHAWREILDWRPIPVNDYEYSAPNIMSRVPSDPASSMPSSLRQTDAQTQDQTEDPIVRRAKLLDTYRVLRKAGMSRDDARALLKPWGIPVDNNLWAQAAPQEEETHITPIVGRRTNAQFETDPELAYQSPPR